MEKNLTQTLKNRLDSMIKRCYDEHNEDFNDFGAKNIKVCDQWLKDSENFIKWAFKNGFDSERKYIYRKNINKDYCPENCVIITQEEHNKNSIESSTECITIEYEENNFLELYIRNSEAFIDKNMLCYYLFGQNIDINTMGARIAYYEKKTLKEYDKLIIPKIRIANKKNATFKNIYNIDFLKKMKINFIFKNKKQIKKYNKLIELMEKWNEYNIIKNTDKSVKKELNTKNRNNNNGFKKIDLIYDLYKICSKNQAIKFLKPLEKIAELEDEKEKFSAKIKEIDEQIKQIENI